VDRTVVVALDTSTEQSEILARTLQANTECFNAVTKLGFETNCSNGVTLHKATYYPLRAQFPSLPSQLVCAARVKATETVKSALTWQKKHAIRYTKLVKRAQGRGWSPPVFKPVKCPHSKLAAIRYDARSFWVQWESLTCSLATVEGRLKLNFVVPKHAQQYIGGQVCSADLCFRKGRHYLHIVVSLPAPVVTRTLQVVGVDLGLNHPAVTSEAQFLGERRWKAQEQRILRLRRQLQKSGSKSAKRHLKKLSGKLLRQHKDHDHVLSRRIVSSVEKGSTIVLENLTDIRDRVVIRRSEANRRLHSWSFSQLRWFVEYKAEALGITVVAVDPRHTSQTCSRCQHQSRNNRRSQSLFWCRQCGFRCNADLNAARNIKAKHRAWLANLGMSLVGGLPVKQPIVPVVGTSSRL
jgi:IS605 OrfB family transposase